jgi:PKD repeat protein
VTLGQSASAGRRARRSRLFSALLVVACLGAGRGVSIAQEPGMGSPDTSGEMGAPSAGASPSIEFPHVPRLAVQAIPTYGTAPMVVGFLVTNTNPNSAPIVSYRWSFGDGQISTLPPTLFYHTYASPGSYVVEVTGTTADGLNSTGVAGVVVRAGP